MTHVLSHPIECRRCGKIHERCTGHRTSGEPCNRWPRRGSPVCDSHGGAAPRTRAKAEVRATIMAWGLADQIDLVDPGETLLKLVTQSAARVELLSRLLAEATEAAERIAAAERAPDGGDLLASESARLDLERVMNHGAVAALVGNTYAADKQAGIFATGEAIRGLAQLEAQERERCVAFAATAIKAGLAERQLRLAEQMAGLMAGAVERAMARLGHDPADPAVRAVVAEEMAALAGGPKTIEGVAA